jgi:hypothetical protein
VAPADSQRSDLTADWVCGAQQACIAIADVAVVSTPILACFLLADRPSMIESVEQRNAGPSMTFDWP